MADLGRLLYIGTGSQVMQFIVSISGASPPSYDEAISNLQYRGEGVSTVVPPLATVQNTNGVPQTDAHEKSHSQDLMQPRSSTAPSAPPLSEIADQADEELEVPQVQAPTSPSTNEGLWFTHTK